MRVLLAITMIFVVTIATVVLLARPAGASASTMATQAHAKKKASRRQTKVTRCVVVKPKHTSGKSSSRRSGAKGKSVVCTVFHLRPRAPQSPGGAAATLGTGVSSPAVGTNTPVVLQLGSAERRTDSAQQRSPARQRTDQRTHKRTAGQKNDSAG